MNVLNMFQEDEPFKPTVKPVAPLVQPPMYTPEIPTNMEQAQEAIIGDTPQFNPELSQAPIPEPTREELLKAKMDEMYKTGFNPMLALIDQGTPQLDEQKAKRLKFAAATNALGQGLSTLFGGVMGAKGGPILEQRNEFTPAALAEYNQMIAADKEAQYRNAMAKSQYVGQLFQMANNNANTEDNRKFSRETQKLSQDFQEKQTDKQIAASKELRAMNGGLSADDRIRVDKSRYGLMSEAQKEKYQYMAQLQEMKNKGIELTYQEKKELEEYKANIVKTTEETESYDNGQAKKTKTETTTIPPANPKKEKSEAEKLAELGFKPKGKLINSK